MHSSRMLGNVAYLRFSAFEMGAPWPSTEDVQRLQVGKPNQAINELGHEIFRGVREG